MGDVLMTYLPTLVRYIIVAISLCILMYGAYRLQIALGVKREAATGRALVLPWVIGFLIFNLFAIGSSLYLSFTEYNLFRAPEWIGLDNYAELFNVSGGFLTSRDEPSSEVLAPRHDEVLRVEIGNGGFVFGAADEDFWRGMRLTIGYAFLSVPIGLAASLGVALLLNQHVRGLGFWRVLYYAPAIIPVVSTVLLWRWMFSQSGLINGLFSPVFRIFNMAPPRWFNDPTYALPAYIIISLWGIFGSNSVILLAGLKGIPKDLYEAAIVDGAGEWAKFWNVTVPMLSPALFYNLVVSTIGALQAFEIAAFINTPASVGTFLNWLIYREAFEFRHMGLASAMAWVMLVLILILTMVIFRSSSAWVFYQGAREGEA